MTLLLLIIREVRQEFFLDGSDGIEHDISANIFPITVSPSTPNLTTGIWLRDFDNSKISSNIIDGSCNNAFSFWDTKY